MAIKIALAGNPNCGKTTLFNALTGANQFVGNWPGVTVEKKEGKLKGHKDVVIMDLPGIYSLSPYTLEEVVARNYLIGEKPDAIINIIDGTNIERNLYLTTQIIELGIPVVMAVNMMDLVVKNGDTINIKALGEALGCEVVEISALKGTGVKKAAEKAIAAAQQKKAVDRVHAFAADVENAIATVEDKLGSSVAEEQKRFFAIKLLEKDSKISEQLTTTPDVSAEIKTLEDKFDDDTESIITNERYTYITSIIGKCVKKAQGKEKLTISDKIDRVVTNRILALPIFAAVMFVVYYVSITTVGGFLTDWTNDTLFAEWIIPGAQSFFESIGCAEWLTGLIVDGVISGVGAVLGLFVFGAVVIAGAFVTAGFFSLTVTLQVSFFFPTFANTTAFPAFLPFTTTLVFFFFERLTTFLPDLMDQTAFFPFFSLIVFFCPTEMLTFFVLSFGAFFFAAAGEDGIDTPRSNAAVIT